jgi:PilZ domain
MDPNIIRDQSGLSESGAHGSGEDGAAYLRRLRPQTGEDPPTAVAHAGSANGPASAPPAFVKERRRSQRYQCSGSVELQNAPSDVHVRGKLTDVSLHGCYVETPTTFPQDTAVALTIESLGIQVRAQATVRVSYPSVGMGICFSKMEAGQQAQLEQLLKALAGERAILNSADEQPRLPEIQAAAAADADACLEALVEFFKKNTVLSRDGFFAIAKRVRRS